MKDYGKITVMDLKESPEMKVNELRKQIRSCDLSYYVYNVSPISDERYDALKQKLRELESQYPNLLTPDSPTQKVGGGFGKGLDVIKHPIKMLSLRTVTDYSLGAAEEFDKSIRALTNRNPEERQICYCCEHKYDGLALSAIYKDGVLTNLSTRGDGDYGEDVTHNHILISGLPVLLPTLIDKHVAYLEVRGEVVITNDNFKFIQEQYPDKAYVNQRNTASGLLRSLKKNLDFDKQVLTFYAYGIGAMTLDKNAPNEETIESVFLRLNQMSTKGVYGTEFNTQRESLRLLGDLGFNYDPPEICYGPDRCYEFYKLIEKMRHNLPVPIDGVVYKVDDRHLQEQCGFTATEPRWAIAHKFKPEEKMSTILSIENQVGRTGVITPVAKIDPIFVGGTTVSSVMLHNQQRMDEKGIWVGAKVMVQRSGDVIPEIVSVIDKPPNGEYYKQPDKCPCCGSDTFRNEDEAKLYCTGGHKCPAQLTNRLLHFVSRDSMDIEGIGETIANALTKDGLVTALTTIYELGLSDLEKVGVVGKNAYNLLENIARSKSVTLDRFLRSLGIVGIGRRLSKRLSEEYGSLESIMEATRQDLSSKIEGLGEGNADVLKSWLEDPSNKKLLDGLLSYISLKPVEKSAPEKKSDKLEGKVFVITGSFIDFDRESLTTLITESGGVVRGSVNSKTNYVVVGKNPGDKVNMAIKLGVKTISETDLVELLK